MKIRCLLAAFATLGSTCFAATWHHKTELGPINLKEEVIDHGTIVESFYLPGFMVNSSIVKENGFCIKPYLLNSNLKGRGSISTGGVALGCYIPYKRLSITPSAGMSFSHLNVYVRMYNDQKRKYRSRAPFASLDFSYKLTSKFRLVASYKYSWVLCKTTLYPTGITPGLSHVTQFVSDTRGPSYTGGLEYDINDNWGVQLAHGLSLSTSQDDNGNRINGTRLALFYQI